MDTMQTVGADQSERTAADLGGLARALINRRGEGDFYTLAAENRLAVTASQNSLTYFLDGEPILDVDLIAREITERLSPSAP